MQVGDLHLIQWLLEGDPCIRWQVMRDLSGEDKASVAQERKKIATEGWGAQLLSHQDDKGLWGGALYNNKWLSTTYTLLLLRQMGLDPDNAQARFGCAALMEGGYRKNGLICFSKTMDAIDNGVAGMVLSILASFNYQDGRIHTVVDFILSQQLEDGKWEPYPGNQNIRYTIDATWLCLEALREYASQYPEQSNRAADAQDQGREFLLRHQLFKQEQTGEIIDPKRMFFSFPPRWHFDILAGLDYFHECGCKKDNRLEDAIGVLRSKQQPDGTWLLQNRHPGKTFFEMEEVGKPSRWNTLRAFRVLKWWEE
jgi:hypothetical protein